MFESLEKKVLTGMVKAAALDMFVFAFKVACVTIGAVIVLREVFKGYGT
jgi:hypothetical protein